MTVILLLAWLMHDLCVALYERTDVLAYRQTVLQLRKMCRSIRITDNLHARVAVREKRGIRGEISVKFRKALSSVRYRLGEREGRERRPSPRQYLTMFELHDHTNNLLV